MFAMFDQKKYVKEWTLQNKERLTKYRQGYHLKKRHGITLEEYDTLLEEQKGVCAICGADDAGHSSKRFVVDHNHTTNNTRGLLCHKCNVMLGYSCDNTQTLLNAVKYLEKYGEKKV